MCVPSGAAVIAARTMSRPTTSTGRAPLPGGEVSPDYQRHVVAVHARRALGEAFAAAV